MMDCPCLDTRTTKWTYPDGGRRCRRHATEDDRALVHELDRRAVGRLGRSSRGVLWPYGPNIDVAARVRLLAWLEEHDLTRANPSYGGCVHWLLTGRCGRWECGGRGRRERAWFDHVTAWNHRGRPAVLVAQPYWITEEDKEQLALVNDERVQVEIRPDSWYGYGTWFIGLWRTSLPVTDAREDDPDLLDDAYFEALIRDGEL